MLLLILSNAHLLEEPGVFSLVPSITYIKGYGRTNLGYNIPQSLLIGPMVLSHMVL